MKGHKASHAGGMMHKNMNKPGEKGTARPSRAKVMSGKDETRRRMIEGPGMQRAQRGPKGRVQ